MKTISAHQENFDHHVDRVMRTFEMLEHMSLPTHREDQIRAAIELVKKVEETCKENFELSREQFLEKRVTRQSRSAAGDL